MASKLSRVTGWAMVWLVGMLGLGGAILLVYQTALVATTAFDLTKVRQALRSGHRTPAETADYLVSPESIDSATTDVWRAVSSRVVPGAVLAIGDSDRILETAGYGRVGWKTTDEKVSPDSTIYDLASLTKAVATTSAVLLLAQDGRIALDDPVQRWLPEFEGRWKDRVTWRQLLTHTSGLPPAAKLRGRAPSQRLYSVLNTSLDEPPGTGVQYSDVSFIVLWTAAQRVAGEPLPQFLERRVWRPLGMKSTAFWPGEACTNCAPTLLLKSGEPYRGKPSDPTAHKLGMPTGNAGLFSTAHDLARFTAMIANGGELDGVRIFRPDFIHELFVQQPGAGHRTLGWQAFCPTEHPTQQQACARPIAYGHTGWTGTSLWVDPARGVWAVILSNRSYNVKRPPSLDELREDVFLDAAGLDTANDTVTSGSASTPASVSPPKR
jgi:CubicO group peptidase (beta-lactamase class C family)